ncbi:HAAS signaling domain-containing protein [Ureibacillus sp. FSL E2-3493]|uniref:HAAS signaling domain-containing protein n=1 Tax=Ureibacillus sp. FSL E2-3493 TaxID=2921367 RepID=UPI00311A2EF1
MNLIDSYIHEVTRRLPQKSREDIGLELKSTIEDMLPLEYTEKDVKQVLQQLGNPVSLASSYNDRPMHLIGPKYFDLYVSFLKMIVPIAAVIAFISVAAIQIIEFEQGETVLTTGLNILTQSIWNIVSIFIQVFFWLTLIFAIVERIDGIKDNQPRTMSLNEWTPDDLKNIPFIPKKRAISKRHVFGSLLWTAIWGTFYFYASHLVGVYEKTDDGLTFIMPSLNQTILNSYWPLIVLVIGMEIGLALYQLFKGQWTKKVAIFNVLREVIGVVTLIIVIINPNLFNHEFLTYLANIFDISSEKVRQFIVMAIMLVPLFSIWNCVDGFRKANSR